MAEDVGRQTILAVIEALARRLGLVVDHRRAEAHGRWEGVRVQVGLTSGPRLPGSRLLVSVELPTDTDLEVVILRRADAHLRTWPHVEGSDAPFPTGVPDLDRRLTVRGEAEVSRVVAWLHGPAVLERLAAVEDVEGLIVDRVAVRSLLAETAPTDAHVATVERLRALALALDAARAAVPPSQTSAPWVPTFEGVAGQLGLRLETCPLAAVGRIDGLDVSVTVPGWGPFRDGVALVDVSRPGPETRPWDLPPADDPLPRRWARRALRAALLLASRVRVGERPLQRLLARVRARPPLDLPPGFAVSGARDHRIVAATRLAPGCGPSLVLAVDRLIQALRAGPGRPGGARPSPYR